MSRTALELTPQEWQAYRPAKAIAQRKQATAIHIQHEKRRAWQVAQQAAEILRNEFHAEKVVVFGSLAHDVWFTHWSDIDLAAWGIPQDRFYTAVATVIAFSPDLKIDLVDPETCSPNLLTTIQREGIDL